MSYVRVQTAFFERAAGCRGGVGERLEREQKLGVGRVGHVQAGMAFSRSTRD
jgi:hypothetical protein